MAEGRRNTELTEMSASLRTLGSRGNPSKEQQASRRLLFQRIIQYLTIGIDMSPLFSDVIMNAHTTDMATKKMLYHYLTYYATVKADLALLTVNTLQKDGRDENPVIRGLAIRSMASMRVPDLVEYLVRVPRLTCSAPTRGGVLRARTRDARETWCALVGRQDREGRERLTCFGVGIASPPFFSCRGKECVKRNAPEAKSVFYRSTPSPHSRGRGNAVDASPRARPKSNPIPAHILTPTRLRHPPARSRLVTDRVHPAGLEGCAPVPTQDRRHGRA
jgi:hypothetical protein